LVIECQEGKKKNDKKLELVGRRVSDVLLWMGRRVQQTFLITQFFGMIVIDKAVN
jgi:hypothetical protein